MKKVVEKPVPVVLEKHTPVTVERPLKYIEKVKIPVTKKDGAKVVSEKHTNAENNVNNFSDNNFRKNDSG